MKKYLIVLPILLFSFAKVVVQEANGENEATSATEYIDIYTGSCYCYPKWLKRPTLYDYPQLILINGRTKEEALKMGEKGCNEFSKIKREPGEWFPFYCKVTNWAIQEVYSEYQYIDPPDRVFAVSCAGGRSNRDKCKEIVSIP